MPNLLPPHFEIPASGGPIVVLTGAGISAESGIPTFRGSEGYWRVGSRNYQPTEMATALAFSAMPAEVWRWYLYRRGICRAAAPNAAHQALVQLEAQLGDRFLLVTQNIDGLHLRAGSSEARTYQNSRQHRFRRCAAADAARRYARCPGRWRATGQGSVRSATPSASCASLRLRRLAATARPVVRRVVRRAALSLLSALRAAEQATALVVIGTSGATTLPTRMCEIVAARGAPFVVVDPEPTVFSQLAERSARGLFLRGAASAVIPSLIVELAERI